ncbi:hypothetical protein QQM79_19835 [Marinobacteraceae bacterium S3BR75-40.1]
MIRAVRSLFILVILPLALGACTGSDTSTNLDRCLNAYNADSPVDAGFASFTVDQQLQYTWFRDFLAGIQPADPDQDGDVADALANLSDEFIQYEGQAPDYTAVTNDLDLMEYLIVQGSIDTFREGREAIATCVDKSETSYYQNSNIVLRDVNEAGDTETQWSLTLRYTYSPDSAQVTRTVRNGTTGDVSVLRYDEGDFNASGFNIPREAFLSYSTPADSDVLQSLVLAQAWDEQRDYFSWSSDEARAFDADFEEEDPDQQYKYLLLELDYQMQQATLWGSTSSKPDECNPITFLDSDQGEASRQSCIDALEALDSADSTEDKGGLLHQYATQAVADRQAQ